MKVLVYALFAAIISVKANDWTVGTTIRFPGDTTDLGEAYFNALFRTSPPYIIRRECPNCADATQKVIYYRRLTSAATWNAYKNMRTDWFSADNKLNTDFVLTNDLQKAIDGVQEFTFCNYDDPGVGSFRDCGLTGYIPYEWTSVNRGGEVTRFSIYTKNRDQWTIGTTNHYPGDTTDIGEFDFNTLFRKSPIQIIRRECPNCGEESQKVIYYRRLTSADTWNAYKNMRSDWFSTNNVLNTDFVLTNDLQKAIDGEQEFTFCNYNDGGVGSFRDCGLTGYIPFKWTATTRGQAARFSIFNADACTDKDCNDDNACTDDSCNPTTGQCEHATISCDDTNPCTDDTCDPETGCINSDVTCADDGNVCNGDEGCSDGVCVSDGIAPVCQDWEVCEAGKGCIRNCDLLDIDEFLTDCSTEFAQNEEQLDDMVGRLDGLEGADRDHDDQIDDLVGRCDLTESEIDALAARVGGPADGSDPEKSLWTLVEEQAAVIEQQSASIAVLESKLFGLADHSDVVGGDGGDDGDDTDDAFLPIFSDPAAFWQQYKDSILFVLIFANILLMFSIMYMRCKSKKKSKSKRYSPVQFDVQSSDIDDIDENVALKK